MNKFQKGETRVKALHLSNLSKKIKRLSASIKQISDNKEKENRWNSNSLLQKLNKVEIFIS
jgi:hypothetical protein